MASKMWKESTNALRSHVVKLKLIDIDSKVLQLFHLLMFELLLLLTREKNEDNNESAIIPLEIH